MSNAVLAPPRRPPPRHRRRRRGNRGYRAGLAVLLVAALALLAWRSGLADPILHHKSRSAAPSTRRASYSPSANTRVQPSPSAAKAIQLGPTPGPINTAFPGLTTFRGNATRDYYGEGPLPKHPAILWRYPATGGLCMQSSSLGKTQTWCGTGWTGQPNVIPHRDGTIEIREGAYDGHYHFLNGRTGERYRPDLVTGDLAKGSATSDSDGYPLYYGGSRDNFLRVVALDRARPTVLWKVNAYDVPKKVWNDDWDGAPLQIGDYLLEGGENSWFYVIRLNRHYDQRGLVQVQPKIVMLVPGWDQQELNAIHDSDISIEDSVAFYNGVVYFANGGGLVQGWDISDLLKGGTQYRRVFRFWDGDDTDASIVIDRQGYLYVGRKMEENVKRPSSFPRDHQIGSLMKLDPRNPDNPVVWSVQLGGFEPDGGVLGTPALYKGIVYSTFTEGGFAAVDARTGRLLWKVQLPGPTWMSPVPIDDQLLVGDCSGVLHNFDISHPRRPPREIWTVQLAGCIESTPAVWHGMIWVGSRGGAIYGIGDPR